MNCSLFSFDDDDDNQDKGYQYLESNWYVDESLKVIVFFSYFFVSNWVWFQG